MSASKISKAVATTFAATAFDFVDGFTGVDQLLVFFAQRLVVAIGDGAVKVDCAICSQDWCSLSGKTRP